jgi:hypothetical protein
MDPDIPSHHRRDDLTEIEGYPGRCDETAASREHYRAKGETPRF